jgi:hypothetical protein
LASDENPRRSPQTLEQGQLELELDAHVAYVVDWSIQPPIESGPAVRRNSVHQAVRAGVARFGMPRLGQSGLDESIQRPIHQWPSDCDDPAQIALGRQLFGDGETVGGTASQDPQDGVLGERWLELVHVEARVGVGE